MDNRELELLQAIRGIVKDEVQQMIDPLKSDMQDMKNDMQDMKSDMQDMKNDMQDMKNDMQDVKSRLTNVENEVKKTNIIIENEIRPNIRLLMEAQSDLYHKLKDVPEEIKELKESMSVLEFVQNEMGKDVYKK